MTASRPNSTSQPADGTAAPVPGWVLDANCPRVERYLLGPELGRGGMGRVHLAWDPILRRTVALKLLLGDDPEMHLRLLREARSQARLEHPHICRIHDLGEHGGRPFIAMQLIDGKSLAELRPGLDHRNVAAILADVAGAVHAAHRCGVIHRDLKPANILVVGGGPFQPFVVDFGLARDFQAMDQTLSWAVLGTPAFMSPEQARGEALGPATDIYSLGATLYAMLTGHPPYEGSTLAGILTQQGQRGVRKFRRLNAQVPRDLETVTLKCLEAEVMRRYPSALALEQDLRRFLAGEPVSARAVGPAGRLARWSQRKPALAATAAAAIVATLLLGAWNHRTSRQAAIRESAAQRFGMEIRDAEHLLRIERMMPLHDIRPAEARLRTRMEAIRQEMEQLGSASQGPGLYAIGRGHLALRDYPKALATLESAWKAGFQAPEVAYSLGLTHYRRVVAEGSWGWVFTAKDYREQIAVRLEPALAWFKRSEGAGVDSPTYGRAMVAMLSGNSAESDLLFDRALVEMPWFYEAFIGKAENRLQELGLALHRDGKNKDQAKVEATLRAIERLLAEAETLAPSDEELQLMIGDVSQSEWVQDSAHGNRDPTPLARASRVYERARVLRPDSAALLTRAANTVLQLGFLKLSTGLDPGPETTAVAREVNRRCADRAGTRNEEQMGMLGLRHNLWWVCAEADQRFGRDPSGALAEAAQARKVFGVADLHFGFSLMLEAMNNEVKGLDPDPPLEEGERNFQQYFGVHPEQKNSFFPRMILGEIHLLQAEVLHRRTQDPGLRLEQAIAELKIATELDRKAAYPYYSLPRAHALAARTALRQGRDPAKAISAALETSRRGALIDPRNAQIQRAAAEAHLVDGLARASRNEDPRPALGSARRSLALADAVNPRDYRAFLIRAELELEEARYEQQRGGDPKSCLLRCAAAIRKGASIKGDEPGFRAIQRRAARLGAPGSSSSR